MILAKTLSHMHLTMFLSLIPFEYNMWKWRSFQNLCKIVAHSKVTTLKTWISCRGRDLLVKLWIFRFIILHKRKEKNTELRACIRSISKYNVLGLEFELLCIIHWKRENGKHQLFYKWTKRRYCDCGIKEQSRRREISITHAHIIYMYSRKMRNGHTDE